MILYLLTISSILMPSLSSKNTQIDEFCSNPVIDAIFTPNQMCSNCIYLFYRKYFFIAEKNGNHHNYRLIEEKEIKSVWNIPNPIDTVITYSHKNLIFFSNQKWFYANYLGQIVSNGSTHHLSHWPSRLIDILSVNQTHSYLLWKENEDVAVRSCSMSLIEGRKIMLRLDCDEDMKFMRISKQNNNKIIITTEKSDQTLPLAELMDLTATSSYYDESKIYNWILFGKNDKMCQINTKDPSCLIRKISTWIKCANHGRSLRSFSQMQIEMILGLVIALLLLSIVSICLAALVLPSSKKKITLQKPQRYEQLKLNHKRGKIKPVISDLKSTESDYRLKYDAQRSTSFIYSGFKHDKPIPNNSLNTYATSESEIFQQRPVDLAVQNKVVETSASKTDTNNRPKVRSKLESLVRISKPPNETKGNSNIILLVDESESEAFTGRPTQLRVKSER